jgi:hypothetical protein
MMHYNPRRSWRRIVLEAKKSLIREAGEAPPERGNDSVDVQIDKFFSDFESEAKSSKNESLDWRQTLRRLLEAEDDEESAKDDEDSESGDQPAEKLTMEEIDVNSFAGSVARLIDNYDSLLEIRDAIVRRATNYLGKNYELDVVEKFKDVMSEQFDIGQDDTPGGLANEKFPAPTADRAFGSGGGGGA